MSQIKDFVKKEVVFFISLIVAIISCFFKPIDETYLSYIDFRTLSLLYCLMVVVAGLRKAGIFNVLAHKLCLTAKNVRIIGLILIGLCFISSMLITNDVALLTFVPFTVAVLGLANQNKQLIHIVVLQTVAANLGSMLTPIGNPQNLYLFSYFSMSSRQFFGATVPIWLISLALIFLLCHIVPATSMNTFLGEMPLFRKKHLPVYVFLLLICFLVVFRVLEWYIMLAIVIATLLIFDRSVLKQADFILLLTFVCFFIFSGNLARIEIVNSFLTYIISGKEFYVSLLASQVISNVPAALLLSKFTTNATDLLMGVNIGGLGTPIASLASLISLKLYSHSEDASTSLFLAEFTVVNVLLLIILSAIYLVIK